MTANKKPLIEEISEQERIQKRITAQRIERLQKLVPKMAESHWNTLVDNDEQNDFLYELGESGFQELANKFLSERTISRAEENKRLREAAEHFEDLRGDQSGLV